MFKSGVRPDLQKDQWININGFKMISNMSNVYSFRDVAATPIFFCFQTRISFEEEVFLHGETADISLIT